MVTTSRLSGSDVMAAMDVSDRRPAEEERETWRGHVRGDARVQ